MSWSGIFEAEDYEGKQQFAEISSSSFSSSVFPTESKQSEQ